MHRGAADGASGAGAAGGAGGAGAADRAGAADGLLRSKSAVFCMVRKAVCAAVARVSFVAVPFVAISVVAVPAVSVPAAAQEDTEDNTMFWSTTLKMIRAKFPQVAQLSTDSLHTWLEASKTAERPLLLDVREKEEYGVSHLKDAVSALTKEEALQALEGVAPDRPVVLYCSVGYRSSEMAGFLQKRGFRKVYNLEGSIFAWANEGRPVYRGDERVHEVHPYDRVWGKLLKKVLRAR